MLDCIFKRMPKISCFYFLEVHGWWCSVWVCCSKEWGEDERNTWTQSGLDIYHSLLSQWYIYYKYLAPSFKYSKLLDIIQSSRIAFSKIVFRDTHMVIVTPMGSSPPRVMPRVISIYGHARCISVFSLPLRNTGECRRKRWHGWRYCLDSPAVIHHPSLCMWTLAILWSVKGYWL